MPEESQDVLNGTQKAKSGIGCKARQTNQEIANENGQWRSKRRT